MKSNLQDQAAALDRADPLAGFRDRFHIPRHGAVEAVYLCGNSLGLMPKNTPATVQRELDAWRDLAVEGHFKPERPWVSFHELFTPPLARLVGAQAEEVVAMNTLSVNLHLMLVSFYRPQASRRKILTAHSAFPSDRYAVESQIRFHGHDPAECLLIAQPRPGEATLRTADILEMIDRHQQDLALVLMDGVNYYTGELLDLAAIAAAAGRHGIPCGFDLAHAIGNVPLALHAWGVDFAVWCSYKYLNGGPGCPGGCFVHARHATRTDLPRFAGWWGHDKTTRFQMGPQFRPIPGAEGWQLSNPPLFSLAALLDSLAIFSEAGLPALRAKSERLTGLLEEALTELPGVEIITPADPARRGCQLSIRVRTHGQQLHAALNLGGVICDWREPDVIRLAPVPLYNRFADVARCAELIGGFLHA